MSVRAELGVVACVPKGQWHDYEEYEYLNIVTDNGSAYIAKKTVPVGALLTDTEYWYLLVKKGDKGDTGNGIASVTKTGTSDLVDTYTITFTDGTTTTYNVTNGAKGDKGDTGNGIASITKTATVGLVDTYTITYTDGTTTTFDVTNGNDGEIQGTVIAPAYDSTKAYKIGNLLTYLGKQYEVTGNDGVAPPVGTLPTDTHYFTERPVSEIIDMIKNGTIVTGHSEVADNLTPYSEDSGTTQDNPFISQATGTDNNSVIVTTGTIARQLEKQGNTVVKNQLLPNLNDFGTTGGATKSYSDGILTVTCVGQTQSGVSSGGIKTPAGHVILKHIKFKGENGVEYSFNGQFSAITATGTWQDFYVVNTVSGTQYLVIQSNVATTFQVTDAYYVDLDKWGFSSDIITDLTSHPEHFSWYYNGSLAYNAGSLQDCNGRYLECGQGRQLWDEEWELGGISSSTGANSIDNTVIRSKNYIQIVPNVAYYLYAPQYCYFRFYDANKNYIGYLDATGLKNKAKNETFVAPSNAIYFRFVIENTTTYGNNITISLYYTPQEGGEGYDQYYPYVEPIRIDTGNEPLKAFDKKLPSGVISRNTGTKTFDANTVWYAGYGGYYTQATDIKKTASLSDVPSIKCSKYQVVAYASLADKTFSLLVNDMYVIVKDSSFTDAASCKSGMTGVTIEYELKDDSKTTEQGTPFSEYAPINDYSYMAWFDTDGNLVSIPQGCKLFYPVDYKGFVDDLVMYTNGDATALAKEEDITDAALNARGYYKMQDLSSDVALVSGLTTVVKRASKIGKLCNISIRVTNDKGSDIPARTGLIYVATQMAIGSTEYMIGFGSLTTGGNCNVIMNSSGIFVDKTFENGDTLTFTLTYSVA